MTLALPIDLGEATPRAANAFQTVVADCPWQPKDELPGPKRGAASHYRTMSTRDLCALAYRFPPIATDALLFSWRLSSMPFDGLEVCRAWGFEPVSEIVWVKVPNFNVARLVRRAIATVLAGYKERSGITHRVEDIRSDRLVLAGFEEARRVRVMLGHYVRLSHEVCIIAARKGAASRIKAHDVPSVIFAPVGRHSEKPAAFYELVERLAPGPYVELFARSPRGREWTAIGDELGVTLDLPLAPSVGVDESARRRGEHMHTEVTHR